MKTFASVVLAGYFFLGGLMPHMDFCELLKIPSLAHHFQEHKELDKEMGIIEFISVHYDSENTEQIVRENVITPVTNTQIVCRLLLEKKKKTTDHTRKT